MTLRYAELQVTTNFSFLRGASHADDLVAQAIELGLSAIAVTDRNSLAGIVRAHVAAKADEKTPGLRLVIGVRLDIEDAPSLLVYPRDRAAYGRLCRLLSQGQLKADKGKCILTLADVARHAEEQIFIALPPDDWDWREVASLAGKPVPAKNQSAKVLPFELTRGRSESSAPLPLTGRGRRWGEGINHYCPPPLTPPREGEGNSVPSPRPLWGKGQGERLPQVSSQRLPLTPTLSPCRAQGHGEREIALAGEEKETLEASLRRIKAAIGTAPLYLAASHTYRGDDRARIAALAALGETCSAPIVATNNVLYHHPDCRRLQDVVTCIREKTTLREAGLRLEANAERHLKSPAEMARLFKGHEAALARTLDIVESCRFSLDELKYEYPDEPVPPGKTPQEHLADLTWKGAETCFRGGVPENVRKTIEKELALIEEREFAPYFLTVNDIVAFARSRDILCQGRGSAANSVVCYCLGITAVNPIEVNLLFERFISSARIEPPDIDVDFEHERREEVIQWIYERYGRDRAGLAATVISYRSRSAVRDVGKVFGLSEDTISALSGMVWGTHAGGVPPEKHVRGAGLDPADPTLAAAMKIAGELMGFPRHLSQHVGGFVLTRGPLVEVVPVGNAAMADRTFIEWDKDDIAALGLMKVDVLALGMLTCIRKAFEMIEKHHGEKFTLASVPREDEKTYDMLCRADSIGVFQVESRAQMNMLPRLKPREFYDLVIEVAIVRPGPIQGDMVHPYLRRRSKVEEVVYPYPKDGDENELKNILGKTLGVPLFQEQAMRIAMVAAEFDDKEVNELRRAMATFRRVGTIGQLEDKMISRMVERGYDKEFATRCFSQIKGFGEYGFPESHAASFALLVYVSAWIKCHYPDAFACALLNSQPMGFYAPAQIVRDAREHGVDVRDADVSFSAWYSTLEDRGEGMPALRLGLKLVDGLSEDDLTGLSCLLPSLLGKRASVRGQPAALSPPSHPAFGRLLPEGRSDLLPSPLRGEGQGEGLPQAPSQRLPLTPTLSPCHVQGHKITPNGEQSVLLHFPNGRGLPAEALGTLADLAARGRLRVPALEKLAAADAFRSLGLNRRQALWEVKALANAPPLPLFSWSETRDTGAEADVRLPEMALSEHVVNDYQTLRLSLKGHPMSFLRDDFRKEGVLSCQDLGRAKNGAYVRVAGAVLVRQRPGNGNVVFMTIEDETGIANIVIWPKLLEKFRKAVMTSRLILIEGRVQKQAEEHADIIHVVASKLIDRSDWLLRLSEWAKDMDVPVANADEVLNPEPGSAHPSRKDQRRIHPRFSRVPKPRHPRNVRVIPKSRDFH